jgi:uncharacterized membrane protein YdfJ with MMPL/SSD domain
VFGRIADLTWKHPKAVLAAVGLFTLLAFALSSDVQQHLKASGFSDPDTESAQAQKLLIEKTGSDAMPGIVVRVTPPAGEGSLPLRSPALRREAKLLTAELLALKGVTRVEDPLAGGSPQLIAPDRSSLLLNAYFSSSDAEILTNAAKEATEQLTSGKFRVTVGGIATGYNEASETIEHDLVRAELIAFPLLALLLLVVFRGVIAASIRCCWGWSRSVGPSSPCG